MGRDYQATDIGYAVIAKIAKIAKQISKIANSEILQKPDHAKLANALQNRCKHFAKRA